MLDPRLARLGHELEQLGVVVVPHGEHICVRLPLAASVVLRVDDGVLRSEPQIGPFPRSSALAGTAATTTIGVGALLTIGGIALPILVAVGGLSALAVELGAFVLVENALTRIHRIWERVRSEPALSAQADPRALDAPRPDEWARVARAADRHA